MKQKVDAIAYVEWGGAYDTRELELIEYPKGKFFYEDLTGGHVSLTQATAYNSPQTAKTVLLRVVFLLGEEHTFIVFGEAGIIRKLDPEAWAPIIGERGFLAI